MSISVVKQYSIFLVNELGALKNFSELLVREKINIIALSQGVRYDASVLRLAVKREDELSHALTKAGFTSVKTDALCIDVKDYLGLAHDIGSILSDNGIDISAIYGSVTEEGNTRWIVVVNDITKALNALEKSGKFND